LSQRLAIFITLVCVAAVVIWVVMPPDPGDPNLIHYLAWVLISALAGALWLPTISGEATDSMASTADFAALMLWGVTPALYIVPLSTFLQNAVVQRRQWVRVLYNSLAMVVVMAAAGWVWTALSGPSEGLISAISAGKYHSWQDAAALLIPILGLGLSYRLVNITLTAIPVAWSSGRSIGEVYREDFFYGEQIISDLALVLLSPLMVVSYATLSYVGVLLFYVPLVVIRDSHRRYVQLRRAQDQLIHSERMAAKGEMAAEIGHELSNYIQAISGRAQILLMEATAAANEKLERSARMIFEQAGHMTILARGLMDYSYKEIKIQRVDLNDLVNRTVEFVRPQNKFDGVEFEIALGQDLPIISADPGQIQQVFLNLVSNAADAMAESSTRDRRIRVTSGLQKSGDFVEVVVADNGPGMKRAVLERVFEPSFTTKAGGHGFGLSTSYRIVHLHGGTITAESELGRGATFRVVLPVRAPSDI
jgi:signal transduction histidine kinase